MYLGAMVLPKVCRKKAHFTFGMVQSHAEEEDFGKDILPDLVEGVRLEIENELEDIDAYREEAVDQLLMDMVRLEGARQEWCLASPKCLHRATSTIHGPLIQAYMAKIDIEDETFVQRCQHGFPYVGEMEKLDYYVVPNFKTKEAMSLETLHDLRLENNVRIVSSLRDGEVDVEKELLQKAFKDADNGWASEPRPINDDDMTERSLARRLGVMEYREYAGGWRMRPVDDETEGGVGMHKEVRGGI